MTKMVFMHFYDLLSLLIHFVTIRSESCLGAIEEGKKKVGSITGKREFEAFLETSMGTREGKETWLKVLSLSSLPESSFLSVMRLEKRAYPLLKTSSSGNEIVLNLCKFSNLRMRCDKEDGNIRRGNVNGKAHILQLKNRLETVIGGLFFICHILLATNWDLKPRRPDTFTPERCSSPSTTQYYYSLFLVSRLLCYEFTLMICPLFDSFFIFPPRTDLMGNISAGKD